MTIIAKALDNKGVGVLSSWFSEKGNYVDLFCQQKRFPG